MPSANDNIIIANTAVRLDLNDICAAQLQEILSGFEGIYIAGIELLTGTSTVVIHEIKSDADRQCFRQGNARVRAQFQPGSCRLTRIWNQDGSLWISAKNASVEQFGSQFLGFLNALFETVPTRDVFGGQFIEFIRTVDAGGSANSFFGTFSEVAVWTIEGVPVVNFAIDSTGFIAALCSSGTTISLAAAPWAGASSDTVSGNWTVQALNSSAVSEIVCHNGIAFLSGPGFTNSFGIETVNGAIQFNLIESAGSAIVQPIQNVIALGDTWLPILPAAGGDAPSGADIGEALFLEWSSFIAEAGNRQVVETLGFEAAPSA